MKGWRNFHRREWHDFFIEFTLVSWGLGIHVSPTGQKHLYCIQVGPITIGYEYKTKAYRRAVSHTKGTQS